MAYEITMNGETRQANLYLEEVAKKDSDITSKKDGRYYRVVMPDACGELPAGLPFDRGILIVWPLNPHFTGRWGVVDLLTKYYGV